MIHEKSPLLRSLACVMAVQVGACGTGVEIDGPVSSLVVRGIVEDGSGSPVPAAIVGVAWRPGACGPFSSFAPSVTTPSTGEFEAVMSEFGVFSHVCVRVDAEPPAGLGLAAGQVLVAAVPLRQGGLDSLVVRLTFSTS